FHMYSAYGVVLPQVLRGIHVGGVLALVFLLLPAARRVRDRVMWYDVGHALLSLTCIPYMFVDFFGLIDRAVVPGPLDVFFGVALILLVLEAVRRTSGPVLLLVVVAFLAYAMTGPLLPEPWTHRGYDLSRLAGQLYMTTEG